MQLSISRGYRGDHVPEQPLVLSHLSIDRVGDVLIVGVVFGFGSKPLHHLVNERLMRNNCLIDIKYLRCIITENELGSKLLNFRLFMCSLFDFLEQVLHFKSIEFILIFLNVLDPIVRE